MIFKVFSNPSHPEILVKLRGQHTSGHGAGCRALPAPLLSQSNLAALPLQPSLFSEIPVWHPMAPNQPPCSLHSFYLPQPRSDRGKCRSPPAPAAARPAGMSVNSHQQHRALPQGSKELCQSCWKHRSKAAHCTSVP